MVYRIIIAMKECKVTILNCYSVASVPLACAAATTDENQNPLQQQPPMKLVYRYTRCVVVPVQANWRK